MVLNGAPVTQRSYSTRLGMMDQDILGVQAAKSVETKSKEPFTIERKTMQRSYGLNIILSNSKRHKHGGEGLIFVPVKQAYISGVSPKLLKWKSLTTAQFQIKVTFSRERKPLYCIHVKQGPTATKFYDYVTPEPALATEWHTTSPDGKNAEFWWDANWMTQMFEKGYGLETRQGGWRYYRTREDKKDVDDEATLLAIVKGMENTLEGEIDHIRTQWKCREAGGSANGNSAHPSQRPSMKPLTINNSISHPENHPPLMTPALSSHYLQSPSVAGHSGSHGYFSKRDRERKHSMDDHTSLSSSPLSASATFSHPLPPKPQPRPRQLSIDQSNQSLSAGSASSKSAEPERGTSESSVASSVESSSTESKGTIPSSSQSPSTSAGLSTIKSAPKLSQVPSHLQPIKSWMTTSPPHRPPPIDKSAKPSPESNPRGGSTSRKSSMGGLGLIKEISSPGSSKAGATAGSSRSSSPNRGSSVSQEDLPQTPTPAQTPTSAATAPPLPATVVIPQLSTISLPRTSLAHSTTVEDTEDVKMEDKADGGEQYVKTEEMKSPKLLSQPLLIDDGEARPSPILGKRTVGSPAADGSSGDSVARRRKLSDGFHPSPKTESMVSKLDTLHIVNTPTISQSSELLTLPLTTEPQNVKSTGSQASNAAMDDPLTLPESEHSQNSTQNPTPIDPHKVRPGHERNGLIPQTNEVPEPLTEGQDVKMEEKASSSVACQDTAEAMELDLAPEIKAEPPTALFEPTDQEKQQAMARARALAAFKVQQQLESQQAKERKLQEDIENFKEKSRVRKEKAEKRRVQEAMEVQVQDRRAQPVRQINQQQQQQRAMSSPQEQRQTYVTRGQSRAVARPESNPSGLNSPKPNMRSLPQGVSAKEQRNSPRLSLSEPQAAPIAQPAKRESVQEEGSEDSRQVGRQGSQLLRPEEEAPRGHRRVTSMDFQPRSTGSLGAMRRDTASGQENIDGQYGHPLRKRLDYGHHGEPNHRRSHSDVGVFYMPARVAIPHPPPTSGTLFPGAQSDVRLSSAGLNGASMQPQQHQQQHILQRDGGAAYLQSSGGQETRNDFAPKPTPVKRESKTRLQFILNDDPPSPESSHGDEVFERQASPEAPAWIQQHPGGDRRLWTDGPVAGLSHGSQFPAQGGYSQRDQVSVGSEHERFPPAADMTLGRRPSSKKPKPVPALIRGNEHPTPGAFEYQGRPSQGEIVPVPPPSERWQQQQLQQQQHSHPSHIQHPANPQGPPVSMVHAQGMTRRMPAEGLSGPPQQPAGMSSRDSFQGMDQAHHGLLVARSTSSLDPHAVPANGPGPIQKRPQRATHSRSSSLSKSGMMAEQNAPQGSPYQNPRHVFAPAPPPHSVPPPGDYYVRGAPSPSVNAGPSSMRSGPPVQQPPHEHQPPQRFQQQQPPHPQQHPVPQHANLNQGSGSRKKIAMEPHTGQEPPPQPGPGSQVTYEHQPAHPQLQQQFHPQQQQQQQQQQMPNQHMHHSQHPYPPHVDTPGHGYEPEPAGHGTPQRQSQSSHPSHGYYEPESHSPAHGGRPVVYASQPPHPSDRQGGPGYPSHHGPTPSHDYGHPPYTGPNMRGESVPKGEGRVVHGGRSSNPHISVDHPSHPMPPKGGPRQHPHQNQGVLLHQHQHQQQFQQQQQQQQHQHQQHQQQKQHPEYRQGQAAHFRPYQPTMHPQHMQPQYTPQNGTHSKASSPRHGHLGDHDPAYRPHPPPGPHGHGGPSW
ncbi:Dcp1p-Dcp2p decapping enzyme complex alpha subunit [Gryganskiella cystojenkinii]|nr:Dcp1p-Dcp2p decapping enzyme complex alpha subunit [Gryganskiella cystojenkinii]